MKLIRGSWKNFLYRKFKDDIFFERIGNRFDFLRCTWKPLCKYGVLNVRFILYADSIWGLDYAYIDIGELMPFLRGHIELFEEMDSVVGTQEVICKTSIYQDILGEGKGFLRV